MIILYEKIKRITSEIHEGKKAKIPKSINKLSFSIISRCLSHSQEERPSFRAIIHTIKRHNFKMINGVDDKIEIIQNQLKSILRKRKKSSSSKIKE